MPEKMPSAEEVQKAGEENMGSEQAGLNEVRANHIEMIRQNSGLDPEVFDQILESFDYEQTGGNTVIKFNVGSHKFTRSSFEGTYYPFFVDNKEVSDNISQRIWDKYERAIVGLKNLSSERIAKEKSVYDEENLARELGL